MPPLRSTKHKRRSYKAGVWAEVVAMIYMMFKGYRLLERRYKCSAGEIDLILTRRNLVVFVEVKYRSKQEDAAFSILPKQQHRISRTALYWTARNSRKFRGDMRFDAILISPWRWPSHIQNAFVDNGSV